MANDPRFGRVLSAMVTPLTADGALDLDSAQRLATHLVDSGHDGLVISGTTGESPTTSAQEKDQLLRAVIEAVGDRAVIIAGAGSNDTAKSIEAVQAAQAAGADGLLAVTPYYNKPPAAGVTAHFLALAEATDLPIMVYDVPHRTSLAIPRESLLRIAEHERIVAVKDAKGDFWAATELMAQTGLDWYSGDDVLTLPHFANGAVGFVGVASQVSPAAYRRLADAAVAGDFDTARSVHRELIPVANAVMNVTQGAIMAKAALALQGHIDSAAMRLPLVEADADQKALLTSVLGIDN